MARYRNPWHKPNEHCGPEFYETKAKGLEYAGHLIFERIAKRVWDVVIHDVCVAHRTSVEDAKRAADYATRLAAGLPHGGVPQPVTWHWCLDSADGARHDGTVTALCPYDALSGVFTSEGGMALAERYGIGTDVLRGAPGNHDPAYETDYGGHHIALWLSRTAILHRLDWLAAGARERLPPGPARATVPLGGEPAHMTLEELGWRTALIKLLARLATEPQIGRSPALPATPPTMEAAPDGRTGMGSASEPAVTPAARNVRKAGLPAALQLDLFA